MSSHASGTMIRPLSVGIRAVFCDSILPKMSNYLNSLRNRTKKWLLLFLVLSFTYAAGAEGNEADHEVKQRERKLEAIEEKEDEEQKAHDEISIIEELFGEKFRLNGFIEFNYEYFEPNDTENDNSDSRTDLYVSSLALVMRAYFNEWSKAKVQLELEDIGKKDETSKARLDEGILTLKAHPVPLYLVGGRTVMPFGVFEDYLIEGTLTEDLYEIDEVGAIFRYAPDFYGLDISFSVYEDASIMKNLEDFDTHEFRAGSHEEGSFKSYIVNVTLEPVKDTLRLSTFYNNEPGDQRRNTSMGGALSLNVWKFILDAEYIAALQREDGENGQENKERAAVAGLAFDVLDSLQLAARYAVFDDDNPGDQDEVLDYRIVTGFNYSLIDLLDLPYLEDVIFSCEYRYSSFERERGSEAADSEKMLQFQLAFEF